MVSEEKITELEIHINKFLKNSYAKTVQSPFGLARRSMLVDYPFIAKL